MAALADMRLLLEEEKIVLLLLSKMKDQLNRLKVEELGLKSKIREDQIRSATAEVNIPDPCQEIKCEAVTEEEMNTAQLNLNVHPNKIIPDFGEQEEEDSDNGMPLDQLQECREHLTYFMADTGEF